MLKTISIPWQGNREAAGVLASVAFMGLGSVRDVYLGGLLGAREQVIYGSSEAVADRLLTLREALGFSSLSAWMNCGGHISHARVLASMRLFAERVIPRLR